MRHRIDGSGTAALACALIAAGHRKGIAKDGLDYPAVGSRRQSVTDAEIHIHNAELEIRNQE